MNIYFYIKCCIRMYKILGASLVVQRLRLHLPMQGVLVQFLVRELRRPGLAGKRPKYKTEAVL